MAEDKVSDGANIGKEEGATAPHETASLREWRLRRHLSHRQLAKLADVTTYTLLRIEKGNPTRPLTRRRIADALGLAETQISEFLEEIEKVGRFTRSDKTSGTG